ncbi:MAG: 16S rRNA (guanine(527)-N(7))-methyltransferase RsmG [Actinomycetota bacterium]|nr:16S rRNA (guanine(527)-N(7))-methyltransferase RsmG [Actinomycetota bacterium]MDZ4179542.1 16S rRNA (guanine(527)-N(7))-methyltransferase RsmG [Coriobacteriia bacterium]
MGALEDLQRLAGAEGIDLEGSVAQRLLRHLDLVLTRTREHNLTSILDVEDAVRHHVVDSLVAVNHMKLPKDADILDLGTGAGYPGMVIAILRPDIRVTLLDSTKKKVDFLTECVDELGISEQTRAVAARAEEFARSEPESQSMVVARAVAPLPSLVELAAPLLRAGGRLVALKGRVDESEVEWADRAAAECGLSRSDLLRYELKSGGEGRSLVHYLKSGQNQRELPRRIGLAQKRPLGKL